VPSKNSYPVIITDLEELIEAGNRDPVKPSIEQEQQAVALLLAEIQTLRARQAELKALRQETTQQLKAAMAKAKDARIQYRSVVKAKIGPRSERLVHFKMDPIRKRVRKPAEEKKQPSGKKPGTDAGAPAPPPDKPAD
jgi:hypothetical protein